MSPPRRWPLHPRPGPLESLSSWLNRLARVYDLSAKDLLARNLDLLDLAVPADLDFDPPAAMLAALAQRTGVGHAQLRAMTLAGWEPWLFDTLHLRHWEAQEAFDTYVRANSVLLAPGEAGTHQVSRFKRWAGPWFPNRFIRRACPVCATDPDRGSALVWRLPLVVGCVEHGCRLVNAPSIEVSLAVNGHPPSPIPVDEPLATLDRYTHQALTAGRVDLPGRTVQAGVWFRLLRSLLDEVSLAAGSPPRSRRHDYTSTTATIPTRPTRCAPPGPRRWHRWNRQSNRHAPTATPPGNC